MASVVKAGRFQTFGQAKTREMLAKELSDMLYGIFVLAEHYGVSL